MLGYRSDGWRLPSCAKRPPQGHEPHLEQVLCHFARWEMGNTVSTSGLGEDRRAPLPSEPRKPDKAKVFDANQFVWRKDNS
jgi:hypothetical protein